MAKHTEHRIWRVSEMVEAILSEPPMNDLLLSQAVCKTWKASIDTSTKLKKKLFSISDDEPLSFVEDVRPILNPLLASTLKAFDRAGINPSSELIINGFATGWEGSWKKMLLSQPPIKKAKAYVNWSNAFLMKKTILENETGLTMGDVTDALLEEVFRIGEGRWKACGRCQVSIEEDEDEYCTF